MLMLSLIRNENMKMFSRPLSWIFILLILAAVMLPVFASFVNQDDPAPWRDQLEQENAGFRTAIDTVESEPERQRLEERIAINEYRLSHDIPPYQSPWAIVNELSFLIPMVALFTAITAAEAVAGEFAGGTIKMLLTRPVSRWKVLLSKYFGSLFFSAILLAILFLSSLTIGVARHGFAGLSDPYLFVVDGSVQERSMLLHCLQLYALKSVHLLVIVTFAFMISTVFRGVNLAIVTTVILLLSGDLIVFMLSDYPWVKYLFFANADLSQYMAGGEAALPGMSLPFSVAVLAVYYVIFMTISWAVFTKREVAAF